MSKNKDFSYPINYHPELSETFRASEERAETTIGSEYREETDREYLRPYDLMVHYANSPLGQHQAVQTSRYPNFHRDLPESLIPPHLESDEEKDAFRRSFLINLADDVTLQGGEKYELQAVDLHPLGHMALASVAFNKLLIDSPAANLTISPFWKQAGRYKEVTHDLGENEHDEILRIHGRVIGDISMAVGKTQDDRDIERSIHDGILARHYDANLSQSMRDAIVALAAHDTGALPADGALIHDLGEISHPDNSIQTALFAQKAAARVLLRERSTENIYLAGHYMALVDQGARLLPKKYEEVFEHNPELRAALGDHVEAQLAELRAKARSLDDVPEIITWRTSDAASEHYGDYTSAA